LHSAVAVARGGKIVFEAVTTAKLTMRVLSPAFIDAYLAAAGERVTESVGCYQLEGLGVHLFEQIDGDHFTILGMPLLPLLAYFRAAGMMRA
jgi:septum formation protein